MKIFWVRQPCRIVWVRKRFFKPEKGWGNESGPELGHFSEKCIHIWQSATEPSIDLKRCFSIKEHFWIFHFFWCPKYFLLALFKMYSLSSPVLIYYFNFCMLVPGLVILSSFDHLIELAWHSLAQQTKWTEQSQP